MEIETKIVGNRFGELVLERSLANGCAGIFIFVWLTGWSYGLISMIADIIYDSSSVPWMPLLIMIVPEIVAIALYLHFCTGRERLRINAQGVEWERRAILRYRHRLISKNDIINVDLLPITPTESNEDYIGTLFIRGAKKEIQFGKGLSGAELHALLNKVREQIIRKQSVKLGQVETAFEIEPISHSERQKNIEEQKQESMPRKIFGWFSIPLFIFIGIMMLFAGIQLMRSGSGFGVIFGLFSIILGLLFSVSFTIACVSLLKDWLCKIIK